MKLAKFILLIIMNNLYELSSQKDISEFIHFNDSSLNDIEFSELPINDYIYIFLEYLKSNTSSTALINILNQFLKKEEDIKLVEDFLNYISSNSTYKEQLENILINYKEKLNKLITLIIKKESIFNSIADIINNDQRLIDFIYCTGKIFLNIFNLTSIITKGNEAEKFKVFMIQNYDKIFNLTIDAFKNITNFKYIANLTSNFIINNIELSHNLFDILKEGNIIEFIVDHLYSNSLFFEVMKSFVRDRKLLTQLFEKLANKNSNLLLNLTKELKEIENRNQTIIFLSKFLANNDELKVILSRIAFNFLNYALKLNKFYDFLIQVLKEIFYFYRKLYNKYYENNSNETRLVSEKCVTFLDYIVFGTELDGIKEDKNITRYYMHKFFFETTSSKNDILIYENCLNKVPFGEEIILPDDSYLNHSSSYIISLIDLSGKRNNIKNSTHYEKYHFLRGFCVPQGIYNTKKKFNSTNGEDKQLYCTQNDYDFLLKSYLRFEIKFNNDSELNIKNIEINRYNEKIEFSEYYMYLIPLFITSIPFLISIFLVIYRNTFIRNKKDIKMIDQTKYSQMKKDDDLNNQKKQEIKNIKKVKLVPRWYKILNEFFNIIRNFNELFDSNQNENSNYNNIGMNYINFIKSVSIILTIFGQLYLILFNVPLKDFGEYQFYELYRNFLYIVPLVGLRYSPRILFSCSGYILSFKYLSYIDQNKDLYFLKFAFRQLYKYLILILFMLNLRYSLYYIICFIFGIKPMWKLFYEQELSFPKNTGEFILKLLTLNFFEKIKEYNIPKDTQDFFDYYWISFNEMAFFLVGIVILSLGYKFKIRIDIGILILAIIIFLLKIIIVLKVKNEGKEIYTTLYYYLFDYGYVMIIPMFNLSYFLIGMYFGLMNYSIKEGINDQNNYNIYKQLKKDEENTIDSIIPQESEKEIDNNSENYNEKNDIDISGIEEDFEEVGKYKKRFSINETFNNISKDSILIPTNTFLKEIKFKPYLLTPINIIKWHRKHNFNCFLAVILFIISLIGILLMISHYIVMLIINDPEDFVLEKTITNQTLNIIYLIDIEFVVFFVQWGLFILFMKGFTYDLFKQSFWEFLSKSYFSFNMICNPAILFLFYESETIVNLNLFNLYIYFFIDLIVIIALTILIYIFIELPLKKLFKFMFNKNYKILDLTEDCPEEEEESDDNEEEEEENDDEEEKEKSEEEENNEDLEENKKGKISIL